MEVTNLNELKKYAQGELVELPSFFEGETLKVRLRRPSLLSLASNGVIPNPLLNTAYRLFNNVQTREGDGKFLKEQGELFNIVASQALVEPTYAEFKKHDLELTDLQLLAIFNYAQVGAKALENFRTIKSSNEDNKNSK
jgi:hypothetical protein